MARGRPSPTLPGFHGDAARVLGPSSLVQLILSPFQRQGVTDVQSPGCPIKPAKTQQDQTGTGREEAGGLGREGDPGGPPVALAVQAGPGGMPRLTAARDQTEARGHAMLCSFAPNASGGGAQLRREMGFLRYSGVPLVWGLGVDGGAGLTMPCPGR